MNLTVVSDQSGEEVSCANILKVLADETRLAVIGQLFSKPMSVGEINNSLGIEQTLLSHHLKVLRESNLVTSERVGKRVVYSLSSVIQGRRRGKTINLGCCSISFQ